MAKKKTRTKKTAKNSKKFSLRLNRHQKVVLGSFLMLFGLALIVAFVSFLFNGQADQSTLQEFSDRSVEAKNWLSKFGALISDFFIYQGFGVASFSIAVLITLSGIYLFFGMPSKKLTSFWFWGILVMIWLSIVLGFFTKHSILGGTIGFEMNDFLQDYTGKIGVFLIFWYGATAFFPFHRIRRIAIKNYAGNDRYVCTNEKGRYQC